MSEEQDENKPHLGVAHRLERKFNTGCSLEALEVQLLLLTGLCGL